MGRQPTGSSFGPTAKIDMLKRRAQLFQQARRFFLDRGYWETDVPQISADTCVDAHIDPISLSVDGKKRYLQTSPEFGMKRLLAAGSGSIFQISHVFRGGESGSRHNREFTMLEWYKVGATYHELMDEVSDLFGELAGLKPAVKITYRQAFTSQLGFDPLTATDDVLWSHANDRGLATKPDERDDLLNFLWADAVEPSVGAEVPQFVHDYPGTQSALAKVRADADGQLVAERFEFYHAGIELCNGYQELTDPDELLIRFDRQNKLRESLGKQPLPVDSPLIAAMRAGLPDTAGVAVGFDRLVMIATGTRRIEEVIPFPDERA